MTSHFARHWRTLAVASASITSSYVFTRDNESPMNPRLLSALKVQAAEYARRNTQKAAPKYRYFEPKQEPTDEDDDDDDNDEKTDTDDIDRSDEHVTNRREKHFRIFASVEYKEEIYMTAIDFLESVISDRPRPRVGRRRLSDDVVNSMLSNTPSKSRGSKRFFRHLEDSGLISFSEYLFLCAILTKSATQFKIAFHMLDLNGNQLIDKRELLMLQKAISDKRMTRRKTTKNTSSKPLLKVNSYYHFDFAEQADTSLLIHFFGKNGRDTLNYAEFKRFTNNFQEEILEIEFNEFSHGFKTVSDLDFTEMLLRYTSFPPEVKKKILKKVKRTSSEPNGITFDQFKLFFAFINNLEEFNVAMRFHQLSNRPISQAEFQRAVKISSGFELEPHLVALIFRIFDANDDQHLSYEEFMAVMEDRHSRGLRKRDHNEGADSKFAQFKRCCRERAKYETSTASD